MWPNNYGKHNIICILKLQISNLYQLQCRSHSYSKTIATRSALAAVLHSQLGVPAILHPLLSVPHVSLSHARCLKFQLFSARYVLYRLSHTLASYASCLVPSAPCTGCLVPAALCTGCLVPSASCAGCLTPPASKHWLSVPSSSSSASCTGCLPFA